ncbi:MAG: hypothetical protein V4719_08910 [Planctomycetota bacterium]
MIDSNKSDLVEQALESLRDAPIPAAPPAQLLSETAERLRSLEAQANSYTQGPRRKMVSQVAPYCRATAICAVVVGAIVWMGLIDHSTVIAFANVQSQLKKVKAVQYVEIRIEDEEWNKAHAQQRDLKINTGDIFFPRRHFVLAPYGHRTETLDPSGQVQSVHIADWQTGTSVMLHPKEKRCMIFESQVTIHAKTGQQTETKIKPTLYNNLYAEIHEIPPGATTQLPAKFLDGKRAVGFLWEQKIVKQAGTDTWKRTYWIDPDTRRPVRIEISQRSTDKRVGPSDWVQRDFVFDADLSPALFHTKPPEGYATETNKILGIKSE